MIVAMIIDLTTERQAKEKRGAHVSVEPSATKRGSVVFNVRNPYTGTQLTWVLSNADAMQLGQMLIDAAGDPLDTRPPGKSA